MNTIQSIGGIELKDVISFQTKLMMGSQFGRVIEAQDKKDIIIACLRMGWNDAFRHTSKNIAEKNEKNKSILEIKLAEWQKTHKEDYDDFICDNILNREILLNVFYDFAKAKETDVKVKVIVDKFFSLQKLFEPYKELDGDKQLCFGHFQKMFNMALKLYLCLYMCKVYLDIDDSLFDEEIIENLKNADCPIDSIILGELEKDTSTKYSDIKWSKFGIKGYPTDYIEVQEKISKLNDVKGNSKLYYDFIAWKK